jgi:hypothetical protein
MKIEEKLEWCHKTPRSFLSYIPVPPSQSVNEEMEYGRVTI